MVDRVSIARSRCLRWQSLPAVAALSLALAGIAARAEESAPAPARTFVPVDTARLLGSPDPLPPLVVVRAFPKLEFVRPVAIESARDGSNRLFVCDQIGRILVFPDRDDASEAEVFLDITDRVRTEHFEEGLLGLAFHPRFAETGELFIYYSRRENPRASVVARYRVSSADPNRADPESGEILLTVEEPYGNHNSGTIEFGPDGKLYVPFGDGGAANDPHGNGQNLGTLLGSILRIDVDRRDPGLPYAIPPDNPFVARDGARKEIWAYGVRNPWRLAFDRLTGDLWLGDVGQDRWEEIDIVLRGGNYGWKVREGRHDFAADAERGPDPFVEPVWEYPREDGKSITGGVVYRGAALPELYGTYLYGDFVTFNIWGLRYDGAQVTSNTLIARSSLPVTAFGENEAGEVYIAAFEAPLGTDVRKLDTGKVFNLDRGALFRLERRVQDAEVATADFPRRLSETGLFADLRALEPVVGAIPYSVNVPLWSDGAKKERFVALPEKGRVQFSPRGHWTFPIGTVLVKTFSLDAGAGRDPHRLETRLLVRSDRGWDGYTYLWDDDLEDARLLDTALVRDYQVVEDGHTIEREWYFPSRSDCRACHTEVAGFVLGLNTRQLNRVENYGGREANQLSVLAELGAFAEPPEVPVTALESFPEWGDPSAPRGDLARAYLDVNCSICHAPGGTGIARADMRYHTPLEQAALVGEVPGQSILGAESGSRVIAPRDPRRSELLLRMLARGPKRMPSLASSRVDWEAVRVIGAWIEAMGE